MNEQKRHSFLPIENHFSPRLEKHNQVLPKKDILERGAEREKHNCTPVQFGMWAGMYVPVPSRQTQSSGRQQKASNRRNADAAKRDGEGERKPL
mmetsp:Transcript_7761/g.22830  ORF Transcript_7761/g.22830 Transcript_7761/m.22830 type:complete len:94 (-) Transcript_7761:796-1077(-)